ncbi:SDR family NAD(P)-dependent oxidoreductase [Croceicoccus bisphenolivorans]|uniref:SDR family NAD(P)-dependent oxidoreductase n=1 Tax=Croceicoccus bisphenolivorans TaxID=1783232 RepID=UPI00082B2857|nr:SDR family oxidoreductase [Croceicoccus bisphenolivorans]
MKTHLIIGGSAGLGGVLARALIASGDAVWLADDAQGAASAPKAVRFHGMDLADPLAPQKLCGEIAADGHGLDSVVVAATMMHGAALEQWQASDWDRSAAINLRLPFLAAQAAAEMLTQSKGCIVFVSSTATLRGKPDTHGYQATKAGLAGLLRSLAAELGPRGVRVNMVLPGWIDTPQTNAFWASQSDPAEARAAMDARIPLRRHGDAGEAAAAIAWLLSGAASYVNGAMLPLDGGETAV